MSDIQKDAICTLALKLHTPMWFNEDKEMSDFDVLTPFVSPSSTTSMYFRAFESLMHIVRGFSS
eukprot:scaffold3197_cov52-Attheya_sp.AAC.3